MLEFMHKMADPRPLAIRVARELRKHNVGSLRKINSAILDTAIETVKRPYDAEELTEPHAKIERYPIALCVEEYLTNPELDSGQRRVLIIDGFDEIKSYYHNFLGQKYDLLHSSNETNPLERITPHSLDYILMDTDQIKKDPIQLYDDTKKTQKAVYEGKSIGFLGADPSEELRELGFALFYKPATIQSIKTTIDTHLILW